MPICHLLALTLAALAPPTPTATPEPPAVAEPSEPTPAAPPDPRNDVRALNAQVVERYAAGRYGEAEPLAREALAAAERTLGADHPLTLTALNNLGVVYEGLGRYAEAEPLMRRALAARERLAGADGVATLTSVSTLAALYNAMGRNAEAEPLLLRALGGRERTLGPEHPSTLLSVNNLADLYRETGRYRDAEPLYRRALAARERLLGGDDPATLSSVNNLAALNRAQARYPEAEALYRRALATAEQRLGPDHPLTLTALTNLGALFQAQGRYGETEPLLLRGLAARERLLGRDHPETLISVNNLAGLYLEQGRYIDAEPLFQRALGDAQRVLGGDHPFTLTAVNNLAGLYSSQGRRADAESLYRRALADREQALGPDDPGTIGSVHNLATFLQAQGDLAGAEPLYRRALLAGERVRGPDHPDTLTSAGNLASVYDALDRIAEAEPLYRRAFASKERVLGAEHPSTLLAANNLAGFLDERGGDAEAEALYARAFAGNARALGQAHPNTLVSAENLVATRIDRGAPAVAILAPARTLLAGVRERRQGRGGTQRAVAQREREGRATAARFALFADAAWAGGGPRQPELRAEAFAALQDAVAGSADRAIAEQAARRYARGRDPALAALMTERQQLEAQWSRLDAGLAATFGEPGDRPESIRGRLEAVQARIDAIDARLRVEAPDYFALISPVALDLASAQALLRPDEAILLAVPSPFGTHVVAVTRDGIDWRRAEWNAARVRAAVQRLRWDSGARVEGSAAELARLREGEGARPRFDRTTAFQLYQQLVAPVAESLAGKSQVYVAAGGSLAGLPFSILVSRPPAGADDDPAALRATRWFGDDAALIHIPSLQSLALLRQAPAAGPPGGFAGIGDPALDGSAAPRDQDGTRGSPEPRQLFGAGRNRDGGLIADIAQLRRMARLPGTARELEAVRRALNAPTSSLILAERATEPAVRAADFSDSRIILFSTHGLTAAEATGVGEAGLVLTPPADARDGDDGFLAASEVTTLSLNADWVILSACNTATGDGIDNPGLGPLARAFFFAGAHNLLASHWPVSDEVAPILITRTLALERGGTPRAEALRLAMREIRADGAHPDWAHPFYWAPFVLIGDGGSEAGR